MKYKQLVVNTNHQKYSILIGRNLVPNILSILKNKKIKFKKLLFVVDKKIPKKTMIDLKKLKNREICFHYFKANEKNKNFSSVNKILDILLKKNFSRQDCLVSIGGGITGDVTSFAANLFKRGIKFINVPSTLLSQVDSSIGGKTGINTKEGKNLIGTFYQPSLVISDINLLRTLPKRELVCGYAEILKHSLIANEKFFKYLSLNIINIFNLKTPIIEKTIYESCKIKKKVVEKDEKEKNLRKILNFGHTFAHAYEATLGYSKKLNHGEAVLLGMVSALKFSLKNNLLKKTTYNQIYNHIKNSNLPNNLKKYFSLKDLDKILSFMSQDKKNFSKNISLILLKRIGRPLLNQNFSHKRLELFLKKELIN